MPGAISAGLGGVVAMVGGLAFICLLPRGAARSPWDSLAAILRAEGAKVGVMVVLMWAVLTSYKEVVVVGFIGTFTVAVIIFSMAVFVRNSVSFESDNNVN
jgi:ATP synthase protein I